VAGSTGQATFVGIWTSNGKKKVKQINPASDGSYRTRLEPGNYLIIFENAENGIARSNLPVAVTIVSQSSTVLDINIDTGIR
jgi:hypothetical protein